MTSAEVLSEFTRNSGTGQLRTHWYDTMAMAEEIVRLRHEVLAWRQGREQAQAQGESDPPIGPV